ncbi:hypothetical protein BZA05DRAFT_467563 [Tricharina praecox]|uniref:uncharacterized protein n=1 Tax=Tricharina praecox TaxID=43433 RepID=UPI00221F7262|nr:uncharacterized protein BZA05DRAFT_467563 [Tricharina praecox]KAI5854134.1 hypothetical protein BZA05DRAFT_467563 [Tricharina praecox]
MTNNPTATSTTTTLRPRRRAPHPHPQRSPSPTPTKQWSTLQSLAPSFLSTPSSSNPPAAASKSWFSDFLSLPPSSPPRSRRPTKAFDTSPPTSPPATTTTTKHEPQLVYVHPVTPSTTLQGVIIAFDTNASSVLRTNQLWPGDPLQSRGELLIPVDACRIKGSPLGDGGGGGGGGGEGDADVGDEEKRWKPHSYTMLPAPLGKTQIGLLYPRRPARRRKSAVQEEEEHREAPPEMNGERKPAWMKPGVHSFHPETEAALPEWEELVKGAEVVGGTVEGWVRRLGEGIKSAAAVDFGGELIEMVAGVGGESVGSSVAGSSTSGRRPTRRRKFKMEDRSGEGEEDGAGERWRDV